MTILFRTVTKTLGGEDNLNETTYGNWDSCLDNATDSICEVALDIRDEDDLGNKPNKSSKDIQQEALKSVLAESEGFETGSKLLLTTYQLNTCHSTTLYFIEGREISCLEDMV